MSVVWCLLHCNFSHWNSLMSSTLVRAAAGFISRSSIKNKNKTTITTVSVAAPCPLPLLLPLPTKENFFPLSGKGAATGRLDEKTLFTLKVNSGLFKTLSLFYVRNSVGELPGIELLRILPKSGYNSPQDSVVLVVVIQNTCIWLRSYSEVY